MYSERERANANYDLKQIFSNRVQANFIWQNMTFSLEARISDRIERNLVTIRDCSLPRDA